MMEKVGENTEDVDVFADISFANAAITDKNLMILAKRIKKLKDRITELERFNGKED